MNQPPTPEKQLEDNTLTVEITSFGSAIESLLRNPLALLRALPKQPGLLLPFGILTLMSAAIFGLVIGTYSGGTQFWAAPLKVGGGLLLSALICFPSLYIFSCLANSPLRLGGITGAYICFLTLLGLLLIALAPILWIFTQSSGSTPFVGSLALIVWLLSFLLSANLLRKLTSTGKTTWQVRLWLLIFLTVTLQMSTALRPLLGSSDHLLPQEKKFFLTHWLESLVEWDGYEEHYDKAPTEEGNQERSRR